MSDSIIVEHVSKKFTKQYHRTLKQVTVAMAKRQRSPTASSRSTTCRSASSRVSRSA